MQISEVIFVAWRNPLNKSWFPIARLTKEKNGDFSFVYTRGAKNSNFPFFPQMAETTEYKSKELFPLFDNRLISEKRPDFYSFLKWLDIRTNRTNKLKILALSEGKKPTDHLEFFQCPQKSSNGKYEVPFIVHGLQYFPKETISRVNELKVGERLYLCPDPQNEYDNDAILLRTGNPVWTAGYCPRYLCSDFYKLVQTNPHDIIVSVKKVNKDAPLGFRLLCEISTTWPKGFEPCSREDFEPLVSKKSTISNLIPSYIE
jgi:hypothetical protein